MVNLKNIAQSLWAALAVTACTSLAQAAGPASTDCPPLTHPPAFKATDNAFATTAEYDFNDFSTGASNRTTVKGRWCRLRFELQPGAAEPKPLDNVNFYKAQFAKLGAKVVYADAYLATARLDGAGRETWMSISSDGGWGSAFFVNVVEKATLKPSLLPPDAKDYRLLGHMPGYVMRLLETKADDDVPIQLKPDADFIKVQGKGYQFHYVPTGRPKPASDLEVLDNYAIAITARGGKVLGQHEHGLTALLEDKGQQIWVSIFVFGDEIALKVVEEGPVAPTKPADIQATFAKTGRLVLYINFDFAKATLKPDADPVIAQIVALLKANPAARISVDGHTDNVGDPEANQKLSEARAQAVAAALGKNGIEPARLSSAGYGATNPIAGNDSSIGRAKNRRVEIVKR